MKKKIINIPVFICVGLLLLVNSLVQAQEKVAKLSESFNVGNDVAVNISAKRSQLVVETWNKNTVDVEAYVTSDKLSEEELKQVAATWKLEVMGNSKRISISSSGNIPGATYPGMQDMNIAVARIPSDFIQPLMVNMVGPMLEQISDANLPPQFYEGMSSLKFDYNAYQKEGEDYVKRYEKEVEQRFGKDFEKAMEEWGENFEKNAEAWSKQLEERMENFEKEHGGDMEAWGENFGKQMEAWGEQFGKQMEKMAQKAEANGNHYAAVVSGNPQGKNTQVRYVQTSSVNWVDEDIKRIIVIKMPKGAELVLNVRHGSVKLKDDVQNLTGDIAHAPFEAQAILGDKTSLTIAYSPTEITSWNRGSLTMSYVKDCMIKNVKSITLSSNASDVEIGKLEEKGIISGSFGELAIAEVGTNFKQLNINLENSDLLLKLPETAFHFNFTGSQSNINYPSDNLEANSSQNRQNQFVNGYRKSRNTNKNININARFSDVELK